MQDSFEFGQVGTRRLGRLAHDHRDVLVREFLPGAETEKFLIDGFESGHRGEEFRVLDVAYNLYVSGWSVHLWYRCFLFSVDF